MITLYESDTLRVLRAAFSELCEKAIYAESELGEHNPCQGYLAHLRDASRAIGAAQTIEELARIEWIAGQAALGAENMDSAI